ncbi:tyrosine-type recombinase/integrase [Thermithiobacillus plumbiphilus]|uniref:Tyrosine-type recombinase/integrase n=1 Tax=Thermithiobacillus plumbiphilus TaxID=1729899 RepID=A0ABU9D8Q1_9PROT
MQNYPIATRPLSTIRGRDVATYLRTRETEGAGPNMRRIELSELRWEDVDLAGGTVYVRDPKNRHPQTVPLSHGAVAGLTGLVFHDLRHEATSRLFERTDLDIMEIRTITGHETLQMLARYTHLRTARLAQRLRGAPRIPLASTDRNAAQAGADA